MTPLLDQSHLEVAWHAGPVPGAAARLRPEQRARDRVDAGRRGDGHARGARPRAVPHRGLRGAQHRRRGRLRAGRGARRERPRDPSRRRAHAVSCRAVTSAPLDPAAPSVEPNPSRAVPVVSVPRSTALVLARLAVLLGVTRHRRGLARPSPSRVETPARCSRAPRRSANASVAWISSAASSLRRPSVPIPCSSTCPISSRTRAPSSPREDGGACSPSSACSVSPSPWELPGLALTRIGRAEWRWTILLAAIGGPLLAYGSSTGVSRSQPDCSYCSSLWPSCRRARCSSASQPSARASRRRRATRSSSRWALSACSSPGGAPRRPSVGTSRSGPSASWPG